MAYEVKRKNIFGMWDNMARKWEDLGNKMVEIDKNRNIFEKKLQN